MLYLFATVFHDLSNGDGRGIADLSPGLECDLRELDGALVRYFAVSMVSEYSIRSWTYCLLDARCDSKFGKIIGDVNEGRDYLSGQLT